MSVLRGSDAGPEAIEQFSEPAKQRPELAVVGLLAGRVMQGDLESLVERSGPSSKVDELVVDSGVRPIRLEQRLDGMNARGK